ncbi:MAG: CpXC domain-containing protein [Termitinemataceae bacterium]
MKHSITCQCEHVFNVDIPEEVNLDTNPQAVQDIINGSFLTIVCPNCDTTLKPELPILLVWPSRQVSYQVLPELDRFAFYKNQISVRPDFQVLIGYPEAADRILVLQENLDPVIIEAIKYYLLLKAEETNPDAEASVWFTSKQEEVLEFHIHGLHADTVAATKIPHSFYLKTQEEYRKNPSAEPFSSIVNGGYISVQNLLRPELE